MITAILNMMMNMRKNMFANDAAHSPLSTSKDNAIITNTAKIALWGVL
jgi:hypothetical protein